MTTEMTTSHQHTFGLPLHWRNHYIEMCSECREVRDVTSRVRSENAKKAAATRARRDAEAPATAAFEVGDILCGSWGYDQTNVEFAQVITTTGRMVTIRKVAQFVSKQGSPSERVYGAKDQFVGAPMRRMVSRYGTVKLHESCSLRKWDGAGRHQTGMGWGH